MADLTRKLKLDTREFDRSVTQVGRSLDSVLDDFQDQIQRVDFDVDISSLTDGIDDVVNQLEDLDLDLDTSAAESAILDVGQLIDRSVSDQSLNVRVEDSEVRSVAGDVEAIDDVDPEVDVKVDDSDVDGLFAKLRDFAKTGAAAIGVAIGAALTAGFNQSIDSEAAVDLLQGQLALTAEEAERAGNITQEAFGRGLGESLEEVNAGLKAANDQIADFADLGDEELAGILEAQLNIAKAFDKDIAESTRAAGQLLKSGLADDAEEAFDIITRGLQNVNGADDFLETIDEFGTVFKDLGLTAEDTLGLFESGLNAGAFNTTFIADAFKEFGIKAREGGEDFEEALGGLGLSYDEFLADLNAGGDRAGDATKGVLEAIQGLEDPFAANEAAVALFGTKAEDLGPSVFAALDPVNDLFEDLEGSAESLGDTINDNLATRFESFRRQALQRLGEITEDYVLPLLDRLRDVFDRISVAVAPVLSEITGGIRAFAAAFQAADGDVTSSGFPGFMERLANLAVRVIAGLKNLADFLRTTLGPSFQSAFKSITDAFATVDFDKIIENFETILQDYIIPVATFLVERLGPIIEGLGEIIGAVIETVANLFEGDWAAAWASAGGIVDGFLEILRGLGQLLLDILLAILPQLQEWAGQLVDLGIEAAINLTAALIDGIQALPGLLLEGLALVIPILAQFALDAVGAWASLSVDLAAAALDALLGLPETLGALLLEVLGVLAAAVPGLLQAGVDLGAAIIRGIGEALIGVGAEVIEIGASVGSSLANGIIDALNTGLQFVNDAIPDKIELRGLPDINLPDNPLPTIPNLFQGAIVKGSPTGTVVRLAENNRDELAMNAGQPFSRNLGLLQQFDDGRFFKQLAGVVGGGNSSEQWILNVEAPPTANPRIWADVLMNQMRKARG